MKPFLSTQDIINKVFLPGDSALAGSGPQSTQALLNAVYDEEKGALRIKFDGDTPSGGGSIPSYTDPSQLPANPKTDSVYMVAPGDGTITYYQWDGTKYNIVEDGENTVIKVYSSVDELPETAPADAIYPVLINGIITFYQFKDGAWSEVKTGESSGIVSVDDPTKLPSGVPVDTVGIVVQGTEITFYQYDGTKWNLLSVDPADEPDYDNVKYAERLVLSGIKNTAGGTELAVVGFNPATRVLNLKAASDLVKVGDKIRFHSGFYDNNSPYNATVAAVNGTSVTIEETLTMDGSTDETAAIIVADMSNWDEDETNSTIGEYLINTGVGATVTGSININYADYASINGGNLNYNTETGYAAFISGDMHYNTGAHADIGGSGHKNLGGESGYGRYNFIRGNSNTVTNADNVVEIGTGNNINGAMGATIIGSNNTEVTGTEAIGFGKALTLVAKFAKAIGYRLKVMAESAFLVGRYGTIEDKAENIGAFGIAGGDSTKDELAWIFRVNKAIANPKYNPSLDPTGSGTDSTGEKQYLPEKAFSTHYQGRLKVASQTLKGVSGNIEMNRDFFGVWDITPGGAFTPDAINWEEGDEGFIVIHGNAYEALWDDEWQWINGEPTELKADINKFKVQMLNGKIYIEDALEIIVLGSYVQDADFNQFAETIQAELDKKVDWTEEMVEGVIRRHIRLANNDNIIGTDLEGRDVNIAEVSEWDKVEIGSAQHTLNLNSLNAVITVNDGDRVVLSSDLEEYVAKVEGKDLSSNDFTNEYIEKIQDLQTTVAGLMGAIVIIGTIPYSKPTQQQLTDQATVLKGEVRLGYALVDPDKNEWYFDGTEWDNLGPIGVATATDTSLGIVMGSTEQYKISIDSAGTMTVNGLADEIQAILATIQQTTDNLQGQIDVIGTNVGNLQSAVSGINDSISALQNDVQANAGNIEANTQEINATNQNVTHLGERLDAIDGTISDLQEADNGLQTQLDDLNTQVGDIAAVLDQINGEVI